MPVALTQRLADVRRDELAATLVAGLFFFCVLTALMVVRPAREALGMQRGIEAIRWLFLGTVVVTLLVNPLFGWLVSRYRRVAFVSTTYLVFAAGLLAFWALLVLAPAQVGERSGQVFYVWFSVFNLFATMLFWALMADRFSLAQSKRLFGVIAVGGTLGAIFGPWLASVLAQAARHAGAAARGGGLPGAVGGRGGVARAAAHRPRRRRSRRRGWCRPARAHRRQRLGGIAGSGALTLPARASAPMC